MQQQQRTRTTIVAGLVIWVAFVLLWGTRPQSDTVATGLDATFDPPQAVSTRVECSPILRWAPRPDGPLPALNAQPPGSQPLFYRRSPCVRWHRQGQLLLALDTVFGVAAAYAAWRYLRRRTGVDDAA